MTRPYDMPEAVTNTHKAGNRRIRPAKELGTVPHFSLNASIKSDGVSLP